MVVIIVLRFNTLELKIGKSFPCFIIAEISQAHDGSLGMAHAYIDAAAEAGCDAVKFQTHIAAAESTLDEPFRIKFSKQDQTRYDYWKRMEFTFEQWQELQEHAHQKGLVFLSTPFSKQAVELLENLDMPAYKIGSGETVADDIIDRIIETGKLILLSTGLSNFKEIDCLVERFVKNNSPYALFQCTSKYPVDLSEVGLNVMKEMKERYHCPVGLSDHSGTVFPSLAAMALDADIIEAHLVFDKRMFGPDTPASLTIEDFKLLDQARKAFYTMKTSPVDKDKMAESMKQMRDTFGKSLSPVRDLTAGTKLEDKMLAAKKPGTGIPLNQKQEVIGKALKVDVSHKRLLRWEDLDD